MPRSPRHKLLRGSALNLVRLLGSLSVSLFLPHFLVHRMSVSEYNGWVLVLQISSYITFLDFGMQTAIGKFVAEYDALSDSERLKKLIGSAFVILCIAALAGIVAVGAMTWYLPQLFSQMPATLRPVVRESLLLVGLSVAIPLPLTLFGTIFIGLQRYGFPTALATISRISSAVCLVLVVLHRGSMLQMAWVMAFFNLATTAAGFVGWRWLVRDRVPFSVLAYSRSMIVELLGYCGTLGIWTLSTLFISGLDTAIVARFDFTNTGYYAIAASGCNFMLMLLGNSLGPLMPAASSLSAQRTPLEMGSLVEKVTRYGVLLLLIISLPLLVGGYSLLRLWVGPAYAGHAVLYLRILAFANIIRYLAYPYTIMVVAVGKQRYATLSPVVEAAVNFTASILLARRYGAVGVALGTLIGACFGVGLHLFVSMRGTQSLLAFKRSSLVAYSMGRPVLAVLPTVVFYRFWIGSTALPMPPLLLLAWAALTVLIAWQAGLQPAERRGLLDWCGRRARLLHL